MSPSNYQSDDDQPRATDSSGINASPTQALRTTLSQFRFDAKSASSIRHSPRSRGGAVGLPKLEEKESELPTLPSEGGSSRKRPATATVAVRDLKRNKVKAQKQRISVAPPEKYAHLKHLDDHLGQGPDALDILFCGIKCACDLRALAYVKHILSPGKRSATVGHHFAHPTNHFWKCLHGAELTDRLLDPSEDATLPERYRLGLTNLVSRPSSQAAELANTEYTAGVPDLLRKIALTRPRILCFVGKQIWESFVKAAAPRAVIQATDRPRPTDAAGGSTTEVSAKSRKKRSSGPTKPTFAFGLQPYKILHSGPNARTRETLVFVVVSTSGLVAGYQREEKIEQFKLLKGRLDELKRGSIDTTTMTVIPVPPDLL
ncbi:uracil-DNA glycosylase-like protein [Lenzites betulinus]|nr:uracil-DNA glycosylase-like protein [Lenzites betulinus]